MKILNPVLLLILSLTLLATMSFSVTADEVVAKDEMATVVVLRAKESAKTSGTSFNVFIDNKSVARMRVTNHQVVHLAAGQHKISSNYAKDAAMTFETLPGKTYYIIAKMKKRGSNMKTTYELVTESIALNSLPALGDKLDG